MVNPGGSDSDQEHGLTSPKTAAARRDPWSAAPPAVSAVPEPGAIRIQIDRLRRRWWLVAAVAMIAFVGSLTSALLTPTVYTGRSALTAASETRAPEQDAYLAQAYSEYFNQPSYQAGLASRGPFPAGVTYNARTAATSPIIYIEATGPDEADAANAAERMADTFRDDINTSVGGEAGAIVSGLQRQLDLAEQRLTIGAALDRDEMNALDTEVRSLQERIVSLQSARTNEVRTLQRQASVSSEAPNPLQDGLFGLIGGLVLGSALVLVLAAGGGRLVSPQDIRDRLGLPTLAVVGGRGSRSGPAERAQDLRRLTNVLTTGDSANRRVLAVTTTSDIAGRSEVALAVATYRASQGEPTILVRTSTAADQDSWAGPGLCEYLAARSAAPLHAHLRDTDVPNLRIMPAGRSAADPYTLFGPERFRALVGELRSTGGLVVLDAPSVSDNPEATAICAAADAVVLIVEPGVTRGDEAVRVCTALELVRRPILGAVLFRPPRQDAPIPPLARIVVGGSIPQARNGAPFPPPAPLGVPRATGPTIDRLPSGSDDAPPELDGVHGSTAAGKATEARDVPESTPEQEGAAAESSSRAEPGPRRPSPTPRGDSDVKVLAGSDSASDT
ncbi:Mrp family chromosome partitioning ATPase [Pseudonocardia sediminis]|uniref:Mrp family chromosome partitioning ATPase n=1 Tax=Pseudonocardia sediminis TaxID=1397368 RepID=A0A4Q7V0B3_PSEST|nr:hypothetical protein [Pseudonocardia sediminis]RZT87882.1 Mrp family chromosome partitioning ATPase [Pseudonocardia sediminis]